MLHTKTVLTTLTTLALGAAFLTLGAEPAAAQAAEPQRIAIYGASGRVGSRIAIEALARGHHVLGLGRTPENIDIEHANMTTARGDVTDPADVARTVAGYDVVISAVSGRDPAITDPMQSIPMRAARALVAALRTMGDDAPRVFAIGGGSTTLDEPLGTWFDDPEDLPEGPRGVQMLSHRAALEYFRRNDDIAWTFVAPSLTMSPGERTGEFRVGPGAVIRDATGHSEISMEDMAIAILDEIENPRYIRRRFTAAY